MFLGIDLGTSEVKVLLMDADGGVVGTAARALPISRLRPRWSEQSPDDWWQATLEAVDQLKVDLPGQLSAVGAIGLSGQMHGATLLDHADRPLRPAILWNDTRASKECKQLSVLAPNLEAVCGNLAMPGFTAPKLLWVAHHEPDIFRQTTTVLLPKDYLRLRLSGEKASDVSDASGTLWLDVGKRAWSDELLGATGLTQDHMPRLVEGSEPSGFLRKELLDRWGMSGPVSIAGGAGDNAAGAIGMGIVAPGQGLVSLGTSGVIFVVTDTFRPWPQAAVHTFCHALPKRWHQMSVMLSAASCLRWAVGVTGAKDEADLLGRVFVAGRDATRSRDPIFLPYLSGERTPHNDAYAQGVLFGLTHDTGAASIGYAVLEGVAFGLADGFAALNASNSRSVHSLSLIGGGARSSGWAQLIADALDRPVHTYAGAEVGAALGAARLARIASGISEEQACIPPRPAAEFAPDRATQRVLEPRYHRFRDLYAAARPLFSHETE
jgi:xylulokinase